MIRPLVTMAVVVLLVIPACGDSDDAETATSTSTSTDAPTSTTTTAPGSSTTIEGTGSTSTTPEAPFIVEDSCHEGSSDATFDDQRGVYAAFLTDIDVSAHTLSFDVVQWLVGQDATDAWQEEYPDDPEGPPNGYYIENENPLVRTATVADDVVVRLVRLGEDADADLDDGTYEELPDYFAEQAGFEDYLSYNPYWLAFDAGAITGICEQYTP